MQFAVKQAPRQFRRDPGELRVLEREDLDEAGRVPLPHPVRLFAAMGALRVVGDEEASLHQTVAATEVMAGARALAQAAAVFAPLGGSSAFW